MQKKLRIADYAVYAASAVIILISLVHSPAKGASLEVKAGDRIYSFPLDKDGVFSVEGDLGPTEIEIKDGRARIISSPCPNKTCISSGFQSTLVCLPNRVIATSDQGAIDESTF